ncbi:hypothetical protein BG011_001732 [Mortierella polycephala]|uniref:FAD-binding domain-containing protein n=1 Tax=Mortierella polycephala TaxID=41804 RepID=A0A9P6TUX8_9FUNG|nr:hypothetical protein BG011_001732 [Mortierella polycephala]
MGDLIDATPKDLISRVFLGEELFKTWYLGRTILIGDACHKMLPSAGQGCISPRQLPVRPRGDNFQEHSAALQGYYDQRFHHAKTQFEFSQKVATVMAGHVNAIHLVNIGGVHKSGDSSFAFFINRTFEKMFANRPQIAWLPKAENRDTGDIIPQKGSKRYTREQQEEEGHGTATAV